MSNAQTTESSGKRKERGIGTAISDFSIDYEGEAYTGIHDFDGFKSHLQAVYKMCAHNTMLGQLVGIMSRTLQVSGVRDGGTLKNQQTRMAGLAGDNRAVKSRFVLGNDDGAYLRLNVMPLQTCPNDPTTHGTRLHTKMTHEMQVATFQGLLNAYDAACSERLGIQSAKLGAVWEVVSWALSLEEVYNFVYECLQCPELQQNEDEPETPDCVYTKALSMLMDAKRLRSMPEIESMESIYALNKILSCVQRLLGKSMENFETMLNGLVKGEESTRFVNFARNNEPLTYTRGPHQNVPQETSELRYNVPVARFPSESTISDALCHFEQTNTADNAVTSAVRFEDRDIPLGDSLDRKQWSTGQLQNLSFSEQEAIVRSSVIEHLVDRYKAAAVEAKSKDCTVKATHLERAAIAKLVQLESLADVFSANLSDLDELNPPSQAATTQPSPTEEPTELRTIQVSMRMSKRRVQDLMDQQLTQILSGGLKVLDERKALLQDQDKTRNAQKRLKRPMDVDQSRAYLSNVADSRLEEVWNDSMREAAISGDRLYAFARQFSGTLHEAVDHVCVIDESMLVKQQKDRQADAKRLSVMASQQHMQLVSSVFRSVISESGLTLGIDDKRGLDGELKVVSNTLRKQVSELTSGSGSEGFFTNSLKLENLLAQGAGEMTLSGLFTRLRDVGLALQEAAVSSTDDSLNFNEPALDFLSSPRNSLLLRWKPEAHAALRSAFDAFQRGMAARHHATGRTYYHRKITAYELIEGCDDELSVAFAEFCAHTLAHQRMFSAGQAAYLGQWSSRANMAAMVYSRNKLISVACSYVTKTERPGFLEDKGWERYFGIS